MNVISVEHLSKACPERSRRAYRLGQIGTGTFRQDFDKLNLAAQRNAFAHDLNVWWARLRGTFGEPDAADRSGRPRQPRWQRGGR